jgi:hypothetical protein
MPFTLFIDETGDHTMHRCDDFRYRFLSLTGVLIERHHEMTTIKPSIQSLKDSHLGTGSPAIIHRTDIINATNGFEPLADAAVREQFNIDLLKLLAEWKYKVWSVCIDKKAHRDKYKVWQHHPYHYCMKLLLERVARCLAKFGNQCDVIVEGRNKKPDKQLKKCYSGIINKGTDWCEPLVYRKVFTNSELKIKDKKADIAGLQLADMVAHPSRCEIMISKGLTRDDGTAIQLAPFAIEVCKILAPKYDQWNGNVYGKKFLP